MTQNGVPREATRPLGAGGAASWGFVNDASFGGAFARVIIEAIEGADGESWTLSVPKAVGVYGCGGPNASDVAHIAIPIGPNGESAANSGISQEACTVEVTSLDPAGIISGTLSGVVGGTAAAQTLTEGRFFANNTRGGGDCTAGVDPGLAAEATGATVAVTRLGVLSERMPKYLRCGDTLTLDVQSATDGVSAYFSDVDAYMNGWVDASLQITNMDALVGSPGDCQLMFFLGYGLNNVGDHCAIHLTRADAELVEGMYTATLSSNGLEGPSDMDIEGTFRFAPTFPQDRSPPRRVYCCGMIVRSALASVLPVILVVSCVGSPPDEAGEGEGEGEGEEPRGTVQLRVHIIGDFHGALEPGPAMGGAAYLAAHLAERSVGTEHTLFVAAGDLIGASPLPSALQHDEPTLEVLGAMGLVASALGNHELDEGPGELLRLQEGGCHPDDACDDVPYAGASFSYLAANVERDDGSLFLPASKMVQVGNARIGIVGAATRTTPSAVVPSGTAGLTFLDEADTIRAEAQALRAAGADAVLAITHVPAGPAGLVCMTGPAADLADELVGDIDLLVSGHSHATFACLHEGLPVVAAGARGEVLGEVDFVLDLDAAAVTATPPTLVQVDHAVPPDAAIDAMVGDAVAAAAVLGDAVVGTVTEELTRVGGESGESALGDVVADAHLAATVELGAQLAFMNTGGLRAALTVPPSGDEAEGEVTYAEAFAVQPFGNILKTFTVSGAELHAILEGQFLDGEGIYQVSGIRYAWSLGAASGARVDPLGVFVGDDPLDLDAEYRVTANEFLLGTPPFVLARDVQTGPVDIEAFTAWLTATSPVSAPVEPRITVVP